MNTPPLLISVMLAVPDVPAAVDWYKRALGAIELWNLGSVAGLEVAGAPFFVGQPENNGWESPAKLGITTARIEVFCDERSSIARSRPARTEAWTRSGITRRHGGSTAKADSWTRSVTSGW